MEKEDLIFGNVDFIFGDAFFLTFCLSPKAKAASPKAKLQKSGMEEATRASDCLARRVCWATKRVGGTAQAERRSGELKKSTTRQPAASCAVLTAPKTKTAGALGERAGRAQPSLP